MSANLKRVENDLGEVKKAVMAGGIGRTEQAKSIVMSQYQYDAVMNLGKQAFIKDPLAQLTAHHRDRSEKFSWSPSEHKDVRKAYYEVSDEGREFVMRLMESTVPLPHLGKDVSTHLA